MPRIRGATHAQRKINAERKATYYVAETKKAPTPKQPVQSPSGEWWFPFNYLQAIGRAFTVAPPEEPVYRPRKKRSVYKTQRLSVEIPQAGYTRTGYTRG